jgi:multidrug resistance efflux pump
MVAEVYLAEGEIAQSGSPALLLYTPELKIVLAVEENQLSQLQVAQPVHIRVDAYPQHTFAGTLATIGPQVDPTTRTVPVTVRVQARSNADAAPLLPGMVAAVEFLQD